MAESRGQKKDSRSGKKASSVSMQVLVNAIARVASSLKRKPKINYVLKIPLNKPLGKVLYTVHSTIEPVTFYKRKDAEAFKKLLGLSASASKGAIVRQEITDEGYIPTYGENK